MHEIGELTPTVAAIAVFADGPTRLRGIAHLRGHETDRLAALCTEINRLGGDAEENRGRPGDPAATVARWRVAGLCRPPDGNGRRR